MISSLFRMLSPLFVPTAASAHLIPACPREGVALQGGNRLATAPNPTTGARRRLAAVVLVGLMLLAGLPQAARGQRFETVFSDNVGRNPYAGLVVDSAGNFYGTTVYGGASGAGTVFKVTPAGALSTLVSFNNTNGANPRAGLVADSAGNFYGTTYFGGASGYGTVFKVTPAGALSTLVSFNNTNGANPRAGLVADSAGNFYGTTYFGGASGAGTVFKVTPAGALSTLVSFNNTNGAYPHAGLVVDSAGNFYGTTLSGGVSNRGTVFKVTPGGVLTTLVSFNYSTDGANPYAGLVADSAGNFYGTTEGGGASGYGTVFKVTPAGALSTLVSFISTNGANPFAGLVADSAGNFYGTTLGGGASGYGTVFKVTPGGVLTTLVSFNGTNGARPYAGLVADSAGNFYGTTNQGGAGGYGTVFKVTRAGALTTIYFFDGSSAAYPRGTPTFGPDGKLYGTAEQMVIWRLNFGTPPWVDGTFGTGGTVTTGIGEGHDAAVAAAVQTDGKIVVAGYTQGASSVDIAVVRYLTDGTLDSTFGSGGKVVTDYGGALDVAWGVAIQADGKIVVAGQATVGGTVDFAVVRYLPDGTLDTTFDGDGKVSTAIGSGDDSAMSLALQADGKIVVAGYSFNGSNLDFATVRYQTNGALDTTFGSGGKITTAFGTGFDYGQSVAVQGDGKILVGGFADTGSHFDFAVARYNGDGSLDGNFNGTGKVTTAIGAAHDQGYALAVQSDGKILLGGWTDNGSNADMALVRYLSSGALDTTFDGDGKVVTTIGSGDDRIAGLAVRGDGTIAVTGWATSGSNTDIAVVLYQPNGAPDPRFSEDGKETVAIGAGNDLGRAAVFQGDERLVVAGYFTNAVFDDVFVLRYLVDFATQAPTLQTPASGTVTKAPVAVSFTLPEAALAGSVKLPFTGSATRTLTLAASEETSGAHSFNFIPAAPTPNPAITSMSGGTDIPDGTYTITLSYQDALGNAVATATSINVTIDTTPPLVNVPANVTAEATSPAGAVVTYTLPPAEPGATLIGASPASGSTFALGTTTVTVTAADAAGNIGTATFTVTVVDTTAPTITGPGNLTVSSTSAAGAVVIFTPSATDAVGVTSLTAVPPSGSLFPIGVTTVTITAGDAAGNTGSGSFTVTVQDSRLRDTDGDGLNDAAETRLVALGFDPLVSQPALVTAFLGESALYTQGSVDATRLAGQADVTGDPGAFNLYTLSAVQDLYLETPIIVRNQATGKWKLTIAVKKATTLPDFLPLPFTEEGTAINPEGKVEFEFTVPESKAFFRLHGR